MHVHRPALDRPLIPEQLHALDQLHDAVGLVADEPREHAVALVGRLLEELCRSADAGERILDLVREHGAEGRHRAGGAAIGQLPVHLVGNGALLEHEHDAIAGIAEGRREDVDDALAADARAADVDPIFADAGATLAHLLDQGHDRRAEGDEIGEPLALQDAQAVIEEGLGRRIGVQDFSALADRQDGERQGIDDQIADGRLHAASASESEPSRGSAKSRSRRRTTSRGSSLVTRRSRSAGRRPRWKRAASSA